MQWDQNLGLAEKGKGKYNSKFDHIILITSNSSPTLDKKYQPLLNTAYPFFFSKTHQKYMHSKDNSSALQNSNTHFGTCAITTAQTLHNCSIRLQTPYNLLAALSAEMVTEQLIWWPSSWCRRGMSGQRQLLFKMSWVPASIFCPAVVVRTHLQSGKVEWMVTSNWTLNQAVFSGSAWALFQAHCQILLKPPASPKNSLWNLPYLQLNFSLPEPRVQRFVQQLLCVEVLPFTCSDVTAPCTDTHWSRTVHFLYINYLRCSTKCIERKWNKPNKTIVWCNLYPFIQQKARFMWAVYTSIKQLEN